MVSKVMNVPENAHYIYAVLNHLSNMSKLLMAKCFWLVEAQEKKGENKRPKKRDRKSTAQGSSVGISQEKRSEKYKMALYVQRQTCSLNLYGRIKGKHTSL